MAAHARAALMASTGDGEKKSGEEGGTGKREPVVRLAHPSAKEFLFAGAYRTFRFFTLRRYGRHATL